MLKNSASRSVYRSPMLLEARKFYEDKIGLTPKEQYAGGLIYGVRRRLVGLHVPRQRAPVPSKASTAFWAVADVVAEVAELKSRERLCSGYDMPGSRPSTASRAGAARGRVVQGHGREHPRHQPT